MSSPRNKKFRSVPSAGKVMLISFWDFNGPTLEHYQDQGQMINSGVYCAMFEVELKPAICSKLRRMLTDGVSLNLVQQQ